MDVLAEGISAGNFNELALIRTIFLENDVSIVWEFVIKYNNYILSQKQVLILINKD